MSTVHLTDQDIHDIRRTLAVRISQHELDSGLEYMDDEWRAKAKAEAARLRTILDKLEGRYAIKTWQVGE